MNQGFLVRFSRSYNGNYYMKNVNACIQMISSRTVIKKEFEVLLFCIFSALYIQVILIVLKKIKSLES